MEVKAKVDQYLRDHPIRVREFTEEDRRRMDEVAKNLYQAVSEGKAVLRVSSAPSLNTCRGILTLHRIVVLRQ